MQILNYVILAFAAVAALDRIFGSRLKLGTKFEKGVMMLGPLTLSMAGMLVMAPTVAGLLSGVADKFPSFLDFSVIPALFLANDMGGAPLALELAGDPDVGAFNAYIVSSMMGCTVSFTLPFALLMTAKEHHSDMLFGILCGIVTIPVGCIVAGFMCGLSPLAVITDLSVLIVFAAVVAVGLIKCEKITVKLFSIIGLLMQALITVGLVLGAVEFVTGHKLLESADTLDNAMSVIINISCIMLGAFPILAILRRILKTPMKCLGAKLGINETAGFGFLSTVGTSISTFESVSRMDRRGIILNSAFSVSASFVFVDHLAFTMSFSDSSAAFVPAMIAGKLISGAAAVVLAYILCEKVKKI